MLFKLSLFFSFWTLSYIQFCSLKVEKQQGALSSRNWGNEKMVPRRKASQQKNLTWRYFFKKSQHLDIWKS